MGKKVLIVDDSALMRRLLSDIIRKDSMFSTIETAVNGEQAFRMMQEEGDYDLLLLDVNMPVMDGIEVLKHMVSLRQKPVTIVVSSVAKQGTITTIKALEYGAFDFITKPSTVAAVSREEFQSRLWQMIYQALGEERQAGVQPPVQSIPDVGKQGVKYPKVTGNHKKIVVVASSTGGPKALQTFLPGLVSQIDAPVLLVQHMPEGFTNSLACRLDELSEIKVMEAMDGMRLEKGVVYIAKGGHQMRLCLDNKKVFRLMVTKEEARNGLRPCADVLLESMQPYEFASCVCAVLTGMGADGTKGILQLYNQNKKNIYIIAQNEETSTVYGMPKAIADKGIVNEVLPLAQIADAIVKHVGVQ